MITQCRMEIQLLDPETYTSVVNHKLRKTILVMLWNQAFSEPMSKQELAERLGIKYQQLVYQLSNHLQEFWEVKDEVKVRGTRMELIGPANPNAVYIALGKEGRIYVVDPIAHLFGPVEEVGLRCDTCSAEEAKHCVNALSGKGIISAEMGEVEGEILAKNGRMPPYRPLDHGIIAALRGIALGERCVLVIPCERCSFLKRRSIIQIE